MTEEEEFEFRARLEREQQTVAPVAQPSKAKQILTEAKSTSLLDQYNPVAGVVEPLLKLGTGAVAKPVSDIAGLLAVIKGAATGKDTSPAQVKQSVQSGMTYEPRTAAGQSNLNPLNAIPNAIGAVVGGVADKAADLVGGGAEPLTVRGDLANATREAIPQALAIAGAKYTPQASKAAAANQAAKEAVRKQKAVGALPKDVNIIEAKDAGFKLPPSEAGGGKISMAVEGAANRSKLIGNIENYNAKNSTKIIHDDLGLPEHVPLTKGAVEEIIKESGKVYEKIKSIEKPFVADKTYMKDLAVLKAKEMAMRKNNTTWNPEFASIMDDMKKSLRNPAEAVELMKTLRAESSRNFNSAEAGMSAKPNVTALAKFQKEAAKALEEMVHRNLEKNGMGNLSAEFLEARKTIAKGKTISKVLDENGIINAEKLGHLKERGAYMSGEMDKVAKFGRAFPDVAGKPKQGAEVPLTGQEGMLGAMGTIAGLAHPLGWGLLTIPAAKIGARSFLQSGMGQGMVGMPKTYTPGMMSEAMKSFSQLSPEAQQAIMYGTLAPKE